MESCWSSAPLSRPTADALLRAVDAMEVGASISPLPNWDQSVFTQVWENVEYSPLACENEGMPENKGQEASLAHSATPESGAYQQAIPNRSDANLEILPGQSNTPFTSGRGRKQKASNEELPVTPSKRAFGAPEGFSAGWMPSNLDVDVDRADDTARKSRLGSTSSNTAFLDRQSQRDPQNRMSPVASPNNMGGPGGLPGQNPANLNPSMNRNNMTFQALQQLELKNLALNLQNQNGRSNLGNHLGPGGLDCQGEEFKGGLPFRINDTFGPDRAGEPIPWKNPRDWDGDKKQRQADLSKAISQQWKALSGEERKHWEGPAKKGSEGLCGEEMNSTVSFVIPPPTTSRPHGRSASAPTPPPLFQTIEIPILFGSNASCPSSPSLLPMISRRAAYTGNPEDMMRNFDFRPNGAEHLIPPAEYPQYLPHQSIMDSSMFSPSTTCSSGPASPASGLYTLSSSYTHPSPFPSEFSMPPSVEEQCNWGWPSDGSPSLMSSDFDLGAIPPIQLGMTKDHQHLEALPMEMESYSPVYDSQLPSEYGYESQQQQFVEDHPEFSQYSMDMDPSSLLQGFNGVVDEMPLTAHEAHSSY
ncbi:slightly ste11-like protein [Marasmius crinis-equi]|uniref:Slightly ste11-like protein n=1 Tax=Marasmius crinis-equi TaxID=585013 RepID=A0ABR3ERW4_9AGAR